MEKRTIDFWQHNTGSRNQCSCGRQRLFENFVNRHHIQSQSLGRLRPSMRGEYPYHEVIV